jgi:hypothetical protein
MKRASLPASTGTQTAAPQETRTSLDKPPTVLARSRERAQKPEQNSTEEKNWLRSQQTPEKDELPPQPKKEAQQPPGTVTKACCNCRNDARRGSARTSAKQNAIANF